MEMKNLLGKHKIVSVNGKPAPAGVTVEFKASENSGSVYMHAKVANIMNGPLKLANRKLSGALVSTMMLGSDDLMNIENALSQGFMEGMTYTVKDGGKLTLQSKTHIIMLVPA
ncbi:conserved hypothetical protein [Leishmania major strain Friedlin]|uniref:Infective insect stage-specific protein n=1 Tax=Leishmania major TaxID=5664 RepID=Q25307_LEIMA|nr:conserved hypothetical protein [Leishmania major strain Friedlin]AAC47003.1 infective insect stage-specific protein [Leishmania major]CAG9572322.1 META_domain_containing_protein_-_putative [Leishmania major strain Friedlin]CAJ03725.1 conserved hypothetical protein [Leishmania major strain Friedlin]|eukprot:XP_001682347.1 conserved hypothetical protein [Leishmania major strain Friedlin]